MELYYTGLTCLKVGKNLYPIYKNPICTTQSDCDPMDPPGVGRSDC